MKTALWAAVVGFVLAFATGAAAYDPMPDPRMPRATGGDASSKSVDDDSPFGPAARARARKAPKFGETDRTRKRDTTYGRSYHRGQR